jgi:N-acetylmuramoyl-L-alanine amidase
MKKAYVAPSTQEKNITALGNTEENVMHKIADALVPMLIESNFDVLRGKKSDTLEQMIRQSDLFAADMHVAIHSNAHDGKSRGCEIFYYPTSTKGKKLAEAIYKYMEPLTPTADRKVKPNAGYKELKDTKAPAVIVEVDFHDNYEGAKWIESNILPIAEAIAQGMCDYAGTPLKKNPYQQAVTEIKRILEAL